MTKTPVIGSPDYLTQVEHYYAEVAVAELLGGERVLGLDRYYTQLAAIAEGDGDETDMGLLLLTQHEAWEEQLAPLMLGEAKGAIKRWKKAAKKERERFGKAKAIGRGIKSAAQWAKRELTKSRQMLPGAAGRFVSGIKDKPKDTPTKPKDAPPKEAAPKKSAPGDDGESSGESGGGSAGGASGGGHAIKAPDKETAGSGASKKKAKPASNDKAPDKSPDDKSTDDKEGSTDAASTKTPKSKPKLKVKAGGKRMCGFRPCKPGEKPRAMGKGGDEETQAADRQIWGTPVTETEALTNTESVRYDGKLTKQVHEDDMNDQYYDQMIAMSRGGFTGRFMAEAREERVREERLAEQAGSRAHLRPLHEDSPLEAPTSGFSRDAKLMSPATREKVLESRRTEIEAFAEDRGLNPNMVMSIAEAAMRMGRVPELRQYGFSGDNAKAIKQFVAGEVLNIAIEDVQTEASMGGAQMGANPMVLGSAFMKRGAMFDSRYLDRCEQDQEKGKLPYRPRMGVHIETFNPFDAEEFLSVEPLSEGATAGTDAPGKGDTPLGKKLKKNSPAYKDDEEFNTASGGAHQPVKKMEWREAMAMEREARKSGARPFEEGSQSSKKLMGKAKADVKKYGSMSKSTAARFDRKQGRQAGIPNPEGSFVRTGRDSGYMEKDPRQEAHKARRGKKTKGKGLRNG